MKTSTKDRLFAIINDMSDEEKQDLIKELEDRQARDMRRYERKSHSMPVDYVAQDHSSQGVIKDISVGGVLLETSEIGGSFSIGEDIILSIQYPNQEKYIKIRGEVVRIEPQRIGVKFTKLT
jgi:hypothetical protein